MYCKKCGKETVGNNDLCEECKMAETATVVKPVELSDPNRPNGAMLSFGKALASTIIGFGSFIMSTVLDETMNIVSLIMMTIISIAGIALSIVFGSMAIGTYSGYKSNGGRRPVAAFVLGIIGVVLAGIATVALLVFLFRDVPNIATYY